MSSYLKNMGESTTIFNGQVMDDTVIACLGQKNRKKNKDGIFATNHPK